MAGQEGLIVVTGPTCSGKTRCALALARDFPIEVVSADSMQVYRYMDIATAKPSPAERAALPHHIIDVVNPDEDFHAAMFTAMAEDRIGQIRARAESPSWWAAPGCTSRRSCTDSPLPPRVPSGSGRPCGPS